MTFSELQMNYLLLVVSSLEAGKVRILLTALQASCFLFCYLFMPLSFGKTLAEDFFTYYACCSKQGTLRYFGKSELNMSGKDFLWDHVFYEVEGAIVKDWSVCCCSIIVVPLEAKESCDGALSTLCFEKDSYGSLRIGPSPCYSDSLVSFLKIFLLF